MNAISASTCAPYRGASTHSRRVAETVYPPRRENPPISIAYIILAHRDPDSVAHLVGRLGQLPGDRTYIHVDRRVDIRPFQAAVEHVDVRFARRRFRTRWGSFALTEATLAAAEEAMQDDLVSHLCLLSGDAYPLAPPPTIRAFLEDAGDRSFMSSSDGHQTERPDRDRNEAWFWNGDLRRVTYRHYQIGDRQLHLPNRFVPRLPRLVPPDDLTLHQGSQWWTLSRRAARDVVEAFVRRRDLRRYFRRVQAPDEWAIQTVLQSSRHPHRIVNDDLHFIHWGGWHAQPLSTADVPAIAHAPKLFARKLEAEMPESPVRRALDELVDSRTTDGGAFLDLLRQRHLRD